MNVLYLNLKDVNTEKYLKNENNQEWPCYLVFCIFFLFMFITKEKNIRIAQKSTI